MTIFLCCSMWICSVEESFWTLKDVVSVDFWILLILLCVFFFLFSVVAFSALKMNQGILAKKQ